MIFYEYEFKSQDTTLLYYYRSFPCYSYTIKHLYLVVKEG